MSPREARIALFLSIAGLVLTACGGDSPAVTAPNSSDTGEAVQSQQAPQPPATPFTTADVLDQLFISRGRVPLIEGTHSCANEPGIRSASLYEVLASRPETRFWIIEYNSPGDLADSWATTSLDRVEPKQVCFATDRRYTANGNLVVEQPLQPNQAQLSVNSAVVSALAALDLPIVGEPLSLTELALAMEDSGLVWRGQGDNFAPFCQAPQRNIDELTLVEIADLGWEIPVSVSDLATDQGIGFGAYIYSTLAAMRSQWNVGANGHATSDACELPDAAVAAGNIVVTLEGMSDQSGLWPRIVEVVADLAASLDDE